ncbi:MAG: AAA family ATPase, partial [Kiritimatiellae bacterium]|nr:AAA family ATPase [Kiritimatiellia bacterium]
MKFEDIPGRLISVRIKSEKNLVEGEILQMLPTTTAVPQFDLRIAGVDGRRRVFAVDDLEGRMLASELTKAKSFLARLAEPGADGSFALQVMVFSSSPIDDVGELEIGIDDKGERACRHIAKVPNLRPSEIYADLKEKCVYTTQNGESYFFVIQGYAVETDIDDKDTNESREVQESDVMGGPSVNATVENSFSVRGANIRFVATKIDAGDREIYVASRINENVSNPDVQIRMALGNLKFCDWTKAHALQSVTKAKLTKIVNGDESYLKTWDKFGEIEGKLLLEKAREFGIIEYANARQDREDTAVVDIIGGKTDAEWEKGVSVDWVDEDPEYLATPMTVEAFINGLVSEEVDDYGNIKKRRAKKKKTPHYEIVSVSKDHNGMTMQLKDPDKSLPKVGHFVLSLAGDKPVIARRNAARRRILDGRSANPQLGLLIEETAEVQLEPPTDIKALSSFVRQKIFKYDPTPKQEEAVKLALSTPDIALIQGPPGTGKTTVITAILERLNEMAGANGARGSVLLTGFQHDAVENMIRRMSINGLPVPKFGRRSGQPEEERTDFERRMDDWCAKCASRIRRNNPKIYEVEEEETLKGLCLQYINAPSKRMALSVLKAIREGCGKMIDTQFTSKVDTLIKRFEHEEKLNSSESKVLDLIRNIRVSSAGFTDDGKERAKDALFGVKNELGQDAFDQDSEAALQAAISWNGKMEELEGILEGLKDAKARMLVQFSTPPEFRTEKQNAQVVEIAKAAIKKIKRCGMKANDEKIAAVAEFLEALETSPIGMSKAVSDYSFAFAATCQQSVNAGMYELKCGGTGTASSVLSYDYVIVDEAARVSPRDLMISLAQGKKIVLVGDHRQLPHIIDDDVAAQMADQETLKMSMFQYLFSNRLKSLYEIDRFNRCVTLDKQYRMHPVLGDFISKNFYERYAPDEHFDSGIKDCSYF